MANFKTHITTSTVLGVGYGALGYFAFDVPLQHTLIAGGMCSVAGMLPDLDSDSGIPVRETLCFLAAVVPMLLIHRFKALGLEPEMMVLIAGIMYIVIRFGVGYLFKKYTVHRGMWHSIPAALMAGMIAFLVCFSHDFGIRLFKSWAVMVGFLSHLVLDEIYAVDLSGKTVRLKKSFGSALKMFSKSMWGNISAYGKLIILGLLIAGDPEVMAHFGREPLEITKNANAWLGEWFQGDRNLLR